MSKKDSKNHSKLEKGLPKASDAPDSLLRTPSFVARQAAEAIQSGGNAQPLLSRLYSTSLPPHLAANVGVPNVFTTTNQTKEKEAKAKETTTSTVTAHPVAELTGARALMTPLYQAPPVLSEAELRTMLHGVPLGMKKTTEKPLQRRQYTPPNPKLTPLEHTSQRQLVPHPPVDPKEGMALVVHHDPETDVEGPFHYIARMRLSVGRGPKEFLYFKIRERGVRDMYNPYDLVLITHAETKTMPKYFTISAAGVTRFEKSDSDYAPLEKWEREFRIYNSLAKLTFFKQQKKWLAYYRWRKFCTQTRMQSRREFLNANLFHLHPNLVKPLFKVRKMCVDIVKSLEMFKSLEECRNLEQFCESEQKQLEFSKRELDKIVTCIRDAIDGACKEAMQNASSNRSDVQQAHALKLAEDMRKAKTQRNAKVDSMKIGPSSTKEGDKKPSYIELSHKRTLCRRLTRYISMCDYMLIDSLCALNMKAVKSVGDEFKFPRPIPVGPPPDLKPKEERRGGGGGRRPEPEEKIKNPTILFTQVLFHEDTIVMRPSLGDFLERTDDIVREFTKAVCSIQRLVRMDAFKPYTSQNAGDVVGEEIGNGPEVAEMITGEESYKVMVAGIRTSVTDAFHVVEEYSATYEPFRRLYIENRGLEPDQIKKNDPPLDWFRDAMLKYQTQTEKIDHIPPNKEVALFTVKTDKLKEFFVPSPVGCLEELHKLLPILAKEKNQALLAELTIANGVLDDKPETVEKFVDFLAFHAKLDQRMETLLSEFESLKELFTLIDSEKIPADEKEELSFRAGTRPLVDRLRLSMIRVEDTQESEKRRFARNIQEQLEGIRENMKDVVTQSKDSRIEDVDAKVDDVIVYVTGLNVTVEGMKSREDELTKFQEFFGFESTPIVELREEVARDVGDKLRLWTSVRDWDTMAKTWSGMVFRDIAAADVQEAITKYGRIAAQVQRTQPDNPVVPRLKMQIDEWKQTYPVIQCLKNPKLKQHHWKEIEEIFGPIKDDLGAEHKLTEMPDYTLGHLLGIEVHLMKDEIQYVSLKATEEDKLDGMLTKVNQMWMGGGVKNAAEFIVQQHKDQKEAYVISGASVEDIIVMLEDSLIIVSTISSSKFCSGTLKDRVDKLDHDLRYMQTTLDKWLEFQRNWIYLENIFGSLEIRTQWKTDAKIFETIDKGFRELMRSVHNNASVYHSLVQRNFTLCAQFEKDNKSLEKVLASLEKKLEEKRNAFPRFYFLSNDDLLDILAKVKLPETIMCHMLKIFDGIKSLSLTGSNEILGMNSMEGEKVEFFSRNVKARGAVEKWLKDVEAEMALTLRRLTKLAVEDYLVRERTEWIFGHAVQIVLMVAQVYWTRSIDEALTSTEPRARMVKEKENNYRNLEQLASLTGRKLNKVHRCLLSTLITLDVHGRDLVDEMVEQGVERNSDFGWTKQLRAAWEVDPTDDQGNLFIRQNNSVFTYGYEYLGAQGRLVITPLTDRVVMTITGALKLCLGAAPAGPAGTGKTETVKDLAKNLARQCIVYNCSDGVTFKMMEKFFMGLIMTGAWTCLDEFNRINIEVLSVIASQLMEIRLGLLQKLSIFTFQGNANLILKNTYGCFITMNPGYAGRSELPDNLKVLFRPVAVMTPDFRMIAEVILYSEGFKNAMNLSLKITQLYKLSSEQLSPQDHYDFGMRALKSILVMAGDLKRSQPDVDEDLTLISACNDANIPKFVAEDIPLFKGIMQDLFPGVSFQDRVYDDLLPAMHADMESKSLKKVASWVTKGIQFYETMIVRHGVMIVGETMLGKTETRDLIQNALTALAPTCGHRLRTARPVHQHVCNPKSITLSELYGVVDLSTSEWKDGVLAVVTKNCVKAAEINDDHNWIVFDGPVDTLWIESMNSVLDDSKLLCLDNGERIKLPDTIHMIFEVQDLSVASPATVSRCGMVYMDIADIGWSPVIHKWMRTKVKELNFGPQAIAYLEYLFLTYIPLGLKFLRTQCKELIASVDINIVQSCCDLFHALAKDAKIVLPMEPSLTSDGPLPHDDPSFKERNEIINSIFSFAFVWSVGGNIDDASQSNFDAFVREALETVVNFGGYGSCFDYFVDFQTYRFLTWESVVKEFKYDTKQPFFNILVPTIDTVRYSFLVKTILGSGKSVLFSGQTGVGKSVIMSDALSINKDILSLLVFTFQFSAQTNSARTQEMIESKLKPKRKNVLGAPPDKTIVFFIDDLNMPQLEVFGASPPIELLRQMMGNGGFFDRKIAGFWKSVQDVTVVAACGPPEGGRNPVTHRLTRFFHLLQIPNLSEEAMKKIFISILNGFFAEGNFAPEVKELIGKFVSSTIDIFNQIREKLRPRPTTPHYTFNLRDMAKTVQGIMQVVPKTCNNAGAASRLYVHEIQRCFYDRLATADDRALFVNELLIPVLRQNFPAAGNPEDLMEKGVMWGDFLRYGAAAEEKIYEEVQDQSKLFRLFDDYLEDHNQSSSSKHMNLVFFEDHCQHLARIIRIIRQPRGNALLVGVGGSGKQSLTRLAAHVAEYKRFELESGKGDVMKEFAESLLELYNIAGTKQLPIVFIVADSQIANESMLEDINNILNCGEVPSLFTVEEREKKINATAEAARERGITSREEIFSYFISRVRDNLHIVLCMSPVGDAFRTRCRQFPSLTNCCIVDWFDEWPKGALLAVAQRLMSAIEFGVMEHVREPLTKFCVDIHASVGEMANQYYEELRRRYYVTPTSYLEFIGLYKTQLDEKQKEITDQLSKLLNGRKKMRETNEIISVMKKELEEMQPLLEQSSKDNAILMETLAVRQEKAAAVQVVVAAQQVEAAEQKTIASEIKADAQSSLDEALPALESALAALDALDKAQISEVKAYASPPKAVETTMNAVLTLFGETDLNWKKAKEYLSDTNFIKRLKDFDRDNIKPQIITRLQRFTADDQFTPAIIANTSTACKGLCMWAHAMDLYYRISKTVAPKRAALEKAEASLAETNAKLAEAQKALDQVESELTQLRAGFTESVRKKEQLELDVKRCTSRLQNAETLSGSLKNEAIRWEQNINALDARLRSLPAEIFLAAACISYFAAFTPTFRKKLVAVWVAKSAEYGLAIPDGFSLRKCLGDEMEIREWQICYLPTDENSVENAIVVNLSTPPRRWPLMIDPQGQAVKWITKMEGRHGLQVIKLTDKDYIRTLETAIRRGSPVLLDDVGETLDPALEPLLLRQIYSVEGQPQPQINLGGPQGAISYDPMFRFYICTKLSNPHYLPEVCIKVTLVNFTVTMVGLEDQMLGDIVALEKPKVEEEKNKSIITIATDQKALKKQEEAILEKLEKSQGNILDNEPLIKELQQAQAKAQLLSKRQEETNARLEQANRDREAYRTTARRTAVLFFVISDLALIDPMYQYSLEYFKKLVAQVLDQVRKSENNQEYDDLNGTSFLKHAEFLRKSLTEASYFQVSRGLFNRHKTIFSLLSCCSIARGQGDIKEEQWQFFLRASAMIPSDIGAKPIEYDWMKPQQWSLVETAARYVPALKDIKESIKAHTESWKQWVLSREPQEEPCPVIDKAIPMTPFVFVLVLRCFREEKMLFSLIDFIKKQIGPQFVESPPFSLQRAHDDSAISTPIIFILSPGSDPMDVLQKFAIEKARQLQYVSLGQGQGDNAKKLITDCKRSGEWALLQNCHLSKSFMPELETQVAALIQAAMAGAGANSVNTTFRLWLTSSPSDFFPISVLQNSIKLTNEAPTGLRANMARCYADIKDLESFANTTEKFPECSKARAFKRILYGLCFFHSIILERKKFGPLGWNVKYEWNDTDFDVSKQWLQIFLEEQSLIPWDSLEYIIGQIIYGGRVTDPQDRKTLMTVLRTYMNQRLLEDNYAFSTSGVYRVPAEGRVDEYLSLIKSLPNNDEPEVFGMHDNANLRFQLQESENLMGTMLSIQPRTMGGGSGISPEQLVMGKCKEFEELLPEVMSRDEAGPNSFALLANGLPNSLSTVLGHELIKFNKLLKKMKFTLSEMQKALQGLTVLSQDLDLMFTSFMNDQVPKLWSSASYPSLKPLGAWFKELVMKVAFVRSWLKKGEPPSFWVPGFFNPHGFMTGVLQAYARQFLVSVDKLGFSFQLTNKEPDDMTVKADCGVYVHGLFTDAWRWDKTKRFMTDSLPGEPYSELPVVHFLPEEYHKPPAGFMQTPLYVTSIRAGIISSLGASSNYVMSIEVPTDRNSDYWILKGAACLTALNY